jgi:hypothetical protein
MEVPDVICRTYLLTSEDGHQAHGLFRALVDAVSAIRFLRVRYPAASFTVYEAVPVVRCESVPHSRF